MAERTSTAQHVLRYPSFHQRAVSGGEGVQDISFRTGKGSHVAGFFFSLPGPARLCRAEAGIDGHHRLLLGKQDPVAVLFRKFAPGTIHIKAQRNQDIALILPLPRRGPCRDSSFPDG
jgi:hypothetical protein